MKKRGKFTEKILILLPLILLLTLMACGKDTSDPTQTLAIYDDNTPDPQRKELENLRETPSVTRAVIENYDGRDYIYYIDLNEAVVTFSIPGQEKETYSLEPAQVDRLNCLLSEYALTVYDGSPYWPTGNYCTMIELFDYSIHYDGGYYQESGATHYPDGWEDFIQSLKEFSGILPNTADQE